MQKNIQKLKAYYLKHRLWILGGLSFVILMQVCSRGGEVNHSAQKDEKSIEERYGSDDTSVAPMVEIYRDQEENRPNMELNTILIMTALVMLVFVASRKGWLQKLFPGVLLLKLSVHRDNVLKKRIARFQIINHTKESITFFQPILIFGGLFKKSRKFRIKGGDGQDVFPLTLTTGTSHQLNINLEQFVSNISELKKYNLIKVELEGSNQKIYRSFWKVF